MKTLRDFSSSSVASIINIVLAPDRVVSNEQPAVTTLNAYCKYNFAI